jgi:hypothetical protein
MANKQWLGGGLLVAASLAVSLVLATGFSKWHWDYWFFRPLPHPIALAASQINQMSEIPNPTSDGEHAKRNMDEKISAILKLFSDDPYTFPQGRIPGHWKMAGLDLTTAEVPITDLQRVEGMVRQLIPVVAPDYRNITFKGFVANFETPERKNLMWVGMSSSQVANDHYRYTELVIDRTDWSVIDQRGFFYDVAGIEGLEWYWLFLLLSAPVMIGALLLQNIFKILLRR